MAVEQLERTTFKTSRLLEFFSEKELQMQIGHSREWWPLALLKELIDNALDACEGAGVLPEIEVTIEPDALSVRDNGPGLPVATLERSLDYLYRVSDKAYYVSPTRGQLGNALKCVWAAPYVWTGDHGRIEVTTDGLIHHIDVTLNRISQQPELHHTTSPDGLVKTGTLVKMHWPGIASYLDDYIMVDSYNAFAVMHAYAMFNPHSSYSLNEGGEARRIERTTDEWSKWRPRDPLSPHWYTAELLRGLIAAYLSEENEGGKPRTVREFVSEFRGLSGTAKQKAATEKAGLSGAYLHDMVERDDVSLEKVSRLLAAMQAESRPVKRGVLGTLGEEHLTRRMAEDWCVDSESVKYKKVEGMAGALPFVLEVAFGIHREEYFENHGARLVGLNWTPALSHPIAHLTKLLSDARVHTYDPVVVVVHLSCPKLDYVDRGKSTLALQPEIRTALEVAIKAVTSGWTATKRQSDRNDKVRNQELERQRKNYRARLLNIKDAAYRVMLEAYMKASGNNVYPANARQVMYAARPSVLQLTGGKCWKNSAYFTQHLLPDYMEEHPAATTTWDVVFDARGHLQEPHAGDGGRIDLGTIEVRRYVSGWAGDFSEEVSGISLAHDVPTAGPENRFRFVLFVEKEGFNPLLERARIADRYDLAIMSTKGMSVTAARQLVEKLSEKDVTILVLHDFDKSGFSIFGTLRGDTRRYRFARAPKVVDLGLRLADAEKMALQSEPVEYDGNVDPRINLRENGATEAECNFLVNRHSSFGGWSGQRVELNAMTSDQFIEWLERKLQAHKIEKITPGEDVLAKAYRRALRRAAVQKAIDEAIRNHEDFDINVPADLREKVKAAITGKTTAWDDAIWELVK